MIKGVVFLASSLNGLAGKETQTSVTLKRNKGGVEDIHYMKYLAIPWGVLFIHIL